MSSRPRKAMTKTDAVGHPASEEAKASAPAKADSKKTVPAAK